LSVLLCHDHIYRGDCSVRIAPAHSPSAIMSCSERSASR
jgi:hypothetical protein